MRSLMFAASLLLTTPAFATEWIFCDTADDTVSIGVLVGGVDFAEISATIMHVGNQDWTSSETYGPGSLIRPAQAFIDDDHILIDLTDGESSEIVAQLRVYLTHEGDDHVQGGVLRVLGHGAWVVSCEGP